MPKPLILALIVVAVLVLVLVGTGMTREPGSADPDEHGWTERFEVGGAPRVEVEHLVSSGCFDPGRRRFLIQASSSCVTTIGPADGPIRLLRLEPPPGTLPPVRIDYVPHDSDGVEIDGWDPDDEHFPLQIPVGPGGGTVTIQCRALTGSCQLGL